ncbi:thioredoxin-disulfide reductase [Aurantimonas sp. MSK8Z-1]|uniref:thioredoxin-disulfide reductase n=1 Tax=Mangrovibrevibacter kandeliae TaxID=2968473 RepID=UPI0021173570|nr:thioredoxin-disulfide reductase [Aurantimonas sp. MSK8Z-1]MCW4116850.1 thioredoxin-disulfide reductase [Aurantimonas sp. MSK8Z-1]
MTHRHAEILILGSGPAGYTAAIYAARAMMKPMLVAGLQEGGQLTITSDVENYPGFADPIQGPWLMEQMKAQAIHVGTEMVSDLIVEADLSVRPFRLKGDGGDLYTCDALVVATGAQAKWLGLESEAAFQGFGVSACATCDGFFYRGKDVVVVGGGNTAVEEALYLSHIARSVTVVHRREEFRAERILRNRLMEKDNVEVIWNAEIAEVVGVEKPLKSVTGVKLRDRVTGEVSERSADGVFVAIGHAPAVELFHGQLDMKPSGYLWVEPGSTRTSVPGVFAAGDVADDVYRQAVTAAGMGCMAALEAERWLVLTRQDEGQREAAE